MKIEEEGDFFFSKDFCFFLKEKTLHELKEDLSFDFYNQIFQNSNLLTIPNYLEFKKNNLEILKKNHKLKIEDNVKNLENQEIGEEKAKVVLEILHSSNFIDLEFKYKIEDEFFKIKDYLYADNINWMGLDNHIKTINKEGKIIKYISQEEFSEDDIAFLFENSRIVYQKHKKEPFKLVIPISHLNYLNEKILPKIKKEFEIIYKGDEKLEVKEKKSKI